MTTKVAYFDEHRDFFRIYLAEFGHAACGAMDPYFRDLSLRQSRAAGGGDPRGSEGGYRQGSPARRRRPTPCPT